MLASTVRLAGGIAVHSVYCLWYRQYKQSQPDYLVESKRQDVKARE
jgi:hypothetical protein